MNYKYILTAILVMSVFSGTASAWLTGYDHRMNITVSNGGASSLSYYQFNFTNDTNVLVAAGNMQASGADCRITDASDNLLPFWNETSFNAAGTRIWANATTLAVGDNTFYMYYGNAGASSVADISTMGCFGDSFEGASLDATTPDSFTVEYTHAIGNYTCHGVPSISNISGTFYTGWYCSYKSDPDGDYPENITRVMLYPNNNTNSSMGYVMGYDGYDHESVSQIEKLGDTYYAFFGNATSGTANSQPWVIYYRNSSDGNTWNGPYALNMEDSNFRMASPRIMKINDTVSWIVYPHNNASLTSLRYIPFNATTKVFGSETDILSDSSSNTFYMSYPLYEPSSNQYFIYYQLLDGSGNPMKVIHRTGYGAWSSPTTIVASTGGAYSQGWTIHWNDKYYLFYHDGGYDIKVMSSTDGISFTAMQTLHSDASNNYWYPAVVPINSTHLAMVYGWWDSTNTKKIMYWDILKFTAGSTVSGRWEEKNSPTVSVANGICSIYYAGTSDWAGIIGTSSFGAYNYAFRQRVKYNASKACMAGGEDAWADDGSLVEAMHPLEYQDAQFYRTRHSSTTQSTDGISELSSYHTDEMRWKSGEVKFYRDDSLKATHTTQVPSSALYPFFATRQTNGTGYTYADWVFVRKYASPEPAATLGAEETGGGGCGAYNITLPLGWSIIGWTNPTASTAHSMGGLIGGNCQYVTERNSTTGLYVTHVMSIPAEDNFAIERGWGYFVRTTAGTLWERDS